VPVEIIFLQNILGIKIWRGGDVQRTIKRVTNVNRFLTIILKRRKKDGNN
jgi:hypothetical protein